MEIVVPQRFVAMRVIVDRCADDLRRVGDWTLEADLRKTQALSLTTALGESRQQSGKIGDQLISWRKRPSYRQQSAKHVDHVVNTIFTHHAHAVVVETTDSHRYVPQAAAHPLPQNL